MVSSLYQLREGMGEHEGGRGGGDGGGVPAMRGGEGVGKWEGVVVKGEGVVVIGGGGAMGEGWK